MNTHNKGDACLNSGMTLSENNVAKLTEQIDIISKVNESAQ